MHSKIQINKIVKGIYQGGVLTQWWGHSLSINVTRDQFANPRSHVSGVCWFSTQLQTPCTQGTSHSSYSFVSCTLSMFWRIYADSSKLLIIWVSVIIFFPLLLSSFAQKCKVMYKRDVYHLPVPPIHSQRTATTPGTSWPLSLSATLSWCFLHHPLLYCIIIRVSIR